MDEAYLRRNIHTAEHLLDLEPEEFGALIAAAMQRDNNRQAQVGNVVSVFYPDVPHHDDNFPRQRHSLVQRATFEAWSWLEAQGLLIWSDMSNGPNGWRSLSRRGEQLSYDEFADFQAARALPRDILHQDIRDRVWSDFIRGHFDSAVHFAAKKVETRVREACGFGDEQIGVALMRMAFRPGDGLLSDSEVVRAEQEARMHLFAGFIGSYKNPHSHRDVNIEDPQEATEIIMMASHLLGIVEARERSVDP